MKTNLSIFEDRLRHAINMLTLGDQIPANVLSGRVLDIGCGIGNGVAAAVQLGAAMAVGVDVDLSNFNHVFDPAEFPDICRYFDIDHRHATLIEADIFKTRFPHRSFDLCIMLDSIEHVPCPAAFIKYAYDVLNEGGYLLVDACPLFYSMSGHHLFDYFPANEYPWVHLWFNFDQLVAEKGVDRWSLDRYRELNRVTHDDLRTAFVEAGFDIVAEHRGVADESKCMALAHVSDRIPSPKFVEYEHLLFEDWVRFVGVKR